MKIHPILGLPYKKVIAQKIIFCTAFVFVFCSITSVSAQTIHQAMGGGGIEKANGIISTSDNALILAGETNSNPAANGNAVLMKISSLGSTQWVKTYGNATDKENLNDLKLTPDQGIIAVGEKYLANPKGRGEVGLLLKTDLSGNTLWCKEFDHNGNEAEGFSLQLTSDAGFVIGGMMKDLDDLSDPFFNLKAEREHFYALKTDKDGNSQWAGYLSGKYGSKALFIQQTKDGGYILTGHVYQGNDRANTKICLVKLTKEGNLSWINVYDNAGKKEETGMVVYQTADEGYIILGTTYDGGAGDADIFLMKTSSSGEVAWSKTYGGASTEFAKSMQATNQGYTITGTTRSVGAGSYDAFLLQVDNNGNVSWYKTYGSASYEMAICLTTTQQGFAFTGLAIGSTASSEMYAVSTDSKGNGGCFMPQTIKTAPFTIATIQPDELKWELTTSTSIVKTSQNCSGAAAPAISTKNMCTGTN